MGNTLPPTLPVGSGKTGPSVSLHAENFATTKLAQHKAREAATTSVGRVIQGKKTTGPSTSIEHPGSVRALDQDEARQQEEIRDRLRYQHIRKIIKERQEEQKKTGP